MQWNYLDIKKRLDADRATLSGILEGYARWGIPPSQRLIETINEQIALEQKAFEYENGDKNMGLLPILIIGGATLISSLGLLGWMHHDKTESEKKQAEAQIAQAECMTAQVNAGYSPDSCKLPGDFDSSSLSKRIEKYVVLGMGISVLFLFTKVVPIFKKGV